MLNKEGQRALVYLANVDSIEPITFLNSEGELEECSGIEKLVTGGWNMVVQKNRFEVDNLFVYAECDTILPIDIPLFSFLEGKRIRTKKLKGVVSQGVCFTIPEILDVMSLTTFGTNKYRFWEDEEYDEGDDWTELVGATKYDEYSNNGKKGDGVKLPPAHAKGAFPSFIPKTDEERIQNLAKELKFQWAQKSAVITEKLDGSSVTIYCKTSDEVTGGICSRNLDLKLDQGSHFIDVGLPIMYSLTNYCCLHERSLALQGEIVGPGIQGNPYNLKEHKIYFFNVFDIDARHRLTFVEACKILRDLNVEIVPLISYDFSMDKTMQEFIDIADGHSALTHLVQKNREGIVVRDVNGSFSFKVISNKWLLKEKE